MDLRDQIREALGRHHPDGGSCTCPRCTDDIRRVMAKVQPALDAKDAEIDRLNATIARVTALVEADEQCGPSIDRGVSCPNILDLDAALEEPKEGTT